MDDSAAAAGSADVPGPVAPGEGAGADEADTEESSSDSDLPDTTAPAAAKAEERAGAADAARPERSAGSDDVDMGDVMSEAAASDPSLTIGELVDKTSEKLKFMAGYMEGAARMVRAESMESSRAGAEHRRVLEHAEKLLRRSEEFLEQQDVEAGAAASGAPPLRRLTKMRASSGTSKRSWAKLRPRPRTSPWRMPPRRRGRRRSEELVPDDPESLYYRAHKSASRVPRQFKAASHVALPPGIMAAMTEEAPDMPAEESDGTFVCPDCDVRPDSAVRWHLHRAACHNSMCPCPRPFSLRLRPWTATAGSSAPVTPPNAKPRKGGRNKVSAFAEPSGTPPQPPSTPGAVGWSTRRRRRPRPEAPRPPRSRRTSRLYDCFYQPVGGPFEGARCGSKRATGHWCPDDNIQPWSAPEDWRNTWSAAGRAAPRLRGQYFGRGLPR